MVFYTASHLSPRHLYTVSEPDVHGILTVDPTLDGEFEFSEDKLLSTSSLDRKLDLVMRKATMKSPNRNLMEDFTLCSRQSSGVWVGPCLVRTPAKERS